MNLVQIILIGLAIIIIILTLIVILIIYVNNKALKDANNRYREMLKKKEYEDKI